MRASLYGMTQRSGAVSDVSDRSSRRTLAGPLLVVAAAVLWGTTGTAQALGPDGSTPLGVGTLRIAVGGIALLVHAFTRRGTASLRACWTGGNWQVTAVGVLAVAAYQVCFFYGVQLTGVAVGTLVTIGSTPVLGGLAGLLIRERLTARWGVATAVLLAGLWLLTVVGSAAAVVPAGILLALAAGASYAAYTVVGRVLLAREVPGESAIATLFAGGAAPLLVLLAASGEPLGWLATPSGAGSVLWLGLAATALPYWLWIRGLATVPVGTSGTLTLAEPVTATLLGVLLLGENLTVAALAGIALIIAGMAVSARPAGDRS